MPNLKLVENDDFSEECLDDFSQTASELNISHKVISISQFRNRIETNISPNDDPQPPNITALAA